MKDDAIRNLLENVEVQPSARCWEAVAGHLAAGAAASSAGTAVGKTVAVKAARHLSAAAVKAIICAAAAVVVAGAVVTAVVLLNQEPKAEAPQTAMTQNTAVSIDASENSEDLTGNSPATASADFAFSANAEKHEIEVVGQPDAATITPLLQSPDNQLVVSEAKQNTFSAPVAANTTPTASASSAPARNSVAQQSGSRPESQNAAPTTSSAPVPVASTPDPILAAHNDLVFETPVSVEIPNVITPNGDGYNDIFIIKGIENCETNKLIVRSRSGIVFQCVDYQNNWDAGNLSAGTYYYQFLYKIHGIEQTRTGTLTIMR